MRAFVRQTVDSGHKRSSRFLKRPRAERKSLSYAGGMASQTRYLLHLAEQVWRPVDFREASAAAARRRESPVKSIVADQALNIRALKDVLAKNGCGPR